MKTTAELENEINALLRARAEDSQRVADALKESADSRERLTAVQAVLGDLVEQGGGTVRDAGYAHSNRDSADAKSATEQVSMLARCAAALIHQAEDLSEKHGVIFSFSVRYGMGGTYHPKTNAYDYGQETLTGWVSSSDKC